MPLDIFSNFCVGRGGSKFGQIAQTGSSILSLDQICDTVMETGGPDVIEKFDFLRNPKFCTSSSAACAQ